MKHMDEIKSFLEGLMLPLAMALFGGLARACKTGFKSWKQFAASMVISAFTGVVVHLAIQDGGLSASMQAAIVASSGYSGGVVLDGLVDRVAERLRSGT